MVMTVKGQLYGEVSTACSSPDASGTTATRHGMLSLYWSAVVPVQLPWAVTCSCPAQPSARRQKAYISEEISRRR
jgi:hypothetical protein